MKIPYNIIPLLQFEPTNAHDFIKVTISQHTSSDMLINLLKPTGYVMHQQV
jgi:hypothetical protein